VSITLQDLIRAAAETLRSPRDAAKQVMAVQMTRRQRWDTLFLIAVLSAILAYLSLFLAGPDTGVMADETGPVGPFMLVFSQTVVMLVMVFAIHFLGRAAGGTGTLDDTILLVSWMQFILICLQVLQIIAAVIMPPVALLLGMAGLVLVFVLLTVFVSELHGFRSLTGVFFSVLVVMMVLATIIRAIFSMLGVNLMGMI